MALRENVTLSWLLVVVVPLLALIIAFTLVKGVPLFRAVQGKIDRINQVMREQITGVRRIRAFNRTPFEQARFETANPDLTDISLRVNPTFVLAFPALMAVMNLTTVADLWVGGHLVDRRPMPIGKPTALLMYILPVLMSVPLAVAVGMPVPLARAQPARP